MENSVTLLDVLRALPVDARAAIFGEESSRLFAGCRLACHELQQQHDSTITHVRLQRRCALGRGPGRGESHLPLSKFSRCSRLSVTASDGAPADPLFAILEGTTPAARQRITHLTLTRGPYDWKGYDRRLVVESAAAQLPALEVLELWGGEDRTRLSLDMVSSGQHRHPRHGVCSMMAALLPTSFVCLRVLALDLVTAADLFSVGALAALPHLRELSLSNLSLPDFITDSSYSSNSSRQAAGQQGGGSSSDRPPPAALQGLSQLRHLQRLLLRAARELRDLDGQHLLISLLGCCRPPSLDTLTLVDLYDDATEVRVELGGGCAMLTGRVDGPGAAAAGMGRGIGSVHAKMQEDRHFASRRAAVLAPALLAAADSLQQRLIPELVLSGERWQVTPAMCTPEALSRDPLPRLLARCECVDVEWLPDIPRSRDPAHSTAPKEVSLSLMRMLGLPRYLELEHGGW
ncbi:hypothetical protein HYH02_005508 [Chlamydomonas schloesseri]|uniref:Uncharacterized protein n=1 Tax=Chlamydomonas schloesseri TaxID=2026947 RepID=A0A835WKH1_9CHLO|nr:hypothetical protein HYH02_005508 [Chlamydomonas schloesseri]|eukprot:KAG2449353.1 hypothetical protein HYH02_005508 [Chlamydomonas schloesseri]